MIPVITGKVRDRLLVALRDVSVAVEGFPVQDLIQPLVALLQDHSRTLVNSLGDRLYNLPVDELLHNPLGVLRVGEILLEVRLEVLHEVLLEVRLEGLRKAL